MNTFNRISVVGLGYVGLPTAALFASEGLEVIGVDAKAEAVESINAGRPHFGEPNLDALVRRVVENGKLRATTKVEPAEAFLMAVPTPLSDVHGPDMSYVKMAAEAIAPVLEKGNLVILESTSPVGSTEQLSQWLAAARPDLTFPHQKGEMADINVAHCPERVLPGKVIEEVVNNARVIGGMTRRCAQRSLSLYRIVARGECKLTNARTAEMAKLTENAFRDVNIAFANELSQICDKHRINVWELIDLANLHPRVNILKPGPGVGGHCIAVDPWFIVDGAKEESRIIKLARDINDGRPDIVCAKVKKRAEDLVKPVIACLGLSYKADVDDLRESPAIDIIEKLAKDKVGQLLVVEPHIGKLPPELEKYDLELTDFDVALDRANLVLLLVDHSGFLQVDRDVLKDKIVIDTRGAW